MDDFTARHFQAWVEEKFRPELVGPAIARMLATYRDDPEWWEAQGWPSLATAADAWSVDEEEEVER